ncbi:MULTISPECIES: HNH endonuclease family protein [Arthrobacter]|uniref:HNH endonuclease family protein n=1 Tax=Arthrobacter TaxID=1663 RepID=UPI001F3066BC|nr:MULTISPECIES: HNH endonuclease family protein [Arthrobacter]
MISQSFRPGTILAALFAAALAVGTLAGCQAPGAVPAAHGPTAGFSNPAQPGATSDAASALATLPVKGRAPKTGYDRVVQFGAAWTDACGDLWCRNGLDTRNDILSRDLTDVVCRTPVPAAAPHCVVGSGTLADPYTGTTISFVRGSATSSAVQIDHRVALSNAWQTGAQQLSQQQRIDLANDPLNLQSTDGPTNQAKGDGDAATWLPPHKGYRCDYVAHQIAVKKKYSLWVTRAEHDAMASVLASCPGQALPTA